jgi:hypothetical protein
MINFSDFESGDLGLLIRDTAKQFDLSAQLIACIILQESAGDPWLNRYEEAFYAKYVMGKTRATLIGHVPKNISLLTEKFNRANSWGLMQIMGQTARECGYGGDSLPKLAVPRLGIFYGCTYLIRCLGNHSLEKALLRYNGGGNPEYDNEVLKRLDLREYTKLIGPTP